MLTSSEFLLDAIDEARILGIFQVFCRNNSTSESKMRLRNIYSLASDKMVTTAKLIFMSEKVELNREETLRMYQLINSFLKKSSFRRPIDLKIKKDLLEQQNNRCVICNCQIGLDGHADHIVPFKYVGDELEDNLQMLCRDCNEKKHDSLDYQIKYLLKLI